MIYLAQFTNRDVSDYAGLYLNMEEIEAVTPLVTTNSKQESKVIGATIYMKSGKAWNVHQRLSEILDTIEQHNEYMKGQTK